MNTNLKHPDRARGDLIDAYLADVASHPHHCQTIGYLPSMLVNITLPHTNPKTSIFERKNGNLTLRMLAGASSGLPFGMYPRLMLTWVCTRSVLNRSPTVALDHTLTGFLCDTLGIKKGRANQLVIDQVKRLFDCGITTETSLKKGHFSTRKMWIAEELDLDDDSHLHDVPWSKMSADMWRNEVTLSNKFYHACIDNAVPIDLKAYAALRGSPLAMDIYVWLTYRMATLHEPSHPITWRNLMAQFGSDYADAWAFKQNFVKALTSVNRLYKTNTQATKKGLILYPGSPHVAHPRI